MQPLRCTKSPGDTYASLVTHGCNQHLCYTSVVRIKYTSHPCFQEWLKWTFSAWPLQPQELAERNRPCTSTKWFRCNKGINCVPSTRTQSYICVTGTATQPRAAQLCIACTHHLSQEAKLTPALHLRDRRLLHV